VARSEPSSSLDASPEAPCREVNLDAPEALLALLGRPATDPSVEQTLEHFKIRRRPEVTIDEDDVDGPVVDSHDRLKNRNAGIEFGFEDQATFTGDETLTPGKVPMLQLLATAGRVRSCTMVGLREGERSNGYAS